LASGSIKSKREIYLKRPGIAALKTLKFRPTLAILADNSAELPVDQPFTLLQAADILGTNPQ
jgi:hypothetical protein